MIVLLTLRHCTSSPNVKASVVEGMFTQPKKLYVVPALSPVMVWLIDFMRNNFLSCSQPPFAVTHAEIV